MKIKVLIAEGFEEVEAITLIDLLRRAGYDLVTVSVMDTKEVKGGHNIPIITDDLLENVNFNDTDVLVIPGGAGVNVLSSKDEVLELIKKFNENNKYIAAICAGPKVLEKAGILNGKKITVYPTSEEKIRSAEIQRMDCVVDGKIITGRGIGAAIPMALRMVEIFSSKDVSEELKKKIVYQI